MFETFLSCKHLFFQRKKRLLVIICEPQLRLFYFLFIDLFVSLLFFCFVRCLLSSPLHKRNCQNCACILCNIFFSKQGSPNLRKELTVTSEKLKCVAGVQRDLPRNHIVEFRFWHMAPRSMCHLALSRLRASKLNKFFQQG